MSRLRLVVSLLSMLASFCGLAQGAQAPMSSLRVRVQVSSAPYYVGQAITLQLSVLAHDERPTVILPKIADADVIPLGIDLKPVSASGIGNLVLENNQFLSRYRIVPRRAGTLRIPAIPVRLDGESGTSKPLQLTIAKVPESGRPSSFLGGVGEFELTADASPTRVRIGQELNYHLRVTGTAALAMTQTPKLGRQASLAPGLRIEPEPAEAVSEPPSRVFRFRLRPTQPGDFVIPPVAIAAFDPKLRRYMTKVSPSVTVQVVDVPRFDTSQLDYAPPPLGESPWPRIPLALGVGVVACLLMGWTWNRLRLSMLQRRSRAAARRLLSQLLRDVDSSLPAPEAARHLTEGLAEYLGIVRARPQGALTPAEAEAEITIACRIDMIGAHAKRLIALCDQAQYAVEAPSTEELLEAAKRLFEALSRLSMEPAKASEAGMREPREAAGTTNPRV